MSVVTSPTFPRSQPQPPADPTSSTPPSLTPNPGCEQELGALIYQRLDASRLSVQKVLGMLQALSNAESTYAHALQRVSSIELEGDGDGPSLRRLVRSFAALPAAVGAMHGHVRLHSPILLCTRRA